MRLQNCWEMAAGLAVLAAFIFTACAGTGSVEASGEILGQRAGVKIAWDNSNVNAVELPGSNKVDVRFLDDDGNEVPPGATGVGEGQSVPIPDGAKYVEVSGPSNKTSCTGCGGQMAGSGECSGVCGSPLQQGNPSQQVPIPIPQVEKYYFISSLEPDLDGSSAYSNISASFLIDAAWNARPAQLHAQVESILLGGHGTAVPGSVTVDTFVKVLPSADGGNLLVADVTTGFNSLSLDWNGNPYADLANNSTSFSASNGWKVVQVFIPLDDFDFDLVQQTSFNYMHLEWQTAEDTHSNVVSTGAAFW